MGLVAAMGTGFPAYASDSRTGGQGTAQPSQPDSGAGADSGSGTIGAHIRISQSYTGSSASGSTTAATSSNADWKPPVCWYEPMYTPEEYEQFIKSAYNGAMEPAASYAKKRADEHYHKGDDGLWWQVKFRDDNYTDACPVTTDNWGLCIGLLAISRSTWEPRTHVSHGQSGTVNPAAPTAFEGRVRG